MAPPASNKPTQLPSETVRGLVSLFLVIHLFAIGVALASYASASVLERQLATTLRPYLRTFNFDLTHVFPAVARLHLTHAGTSDIDFRITGEAKLPDGKSGTWQLPRAGLFPPIRHSRDQALANVVGGLMERENDEQEALLPRALAAAELRRTGAKSGKIAVTAHYLLDLEDLNAPETKLRNPFDASYYRTVFEARVITNRTGDVDLLKFAAKGEVAPVTGARGGPAKSPASKKE